MLLLWLAVVGWASAPAPSPETTLRIAAERYREQPPPIGCGAPLVVPPQPLRPVELALVLAALEVLGSPPVGPELQAPLLDAAEVLQRRRHLDDMELVAWAALRLHPEGGLGERAAGYLVDLHHLTGRTEDLGRILDGLREFPTLGSPGFRTELDQVRASFAKWEQRAPMTP